MTKPPTEADLKVRKYVSQIYDLLDKEESVSCILSVLCGALVGAAVTNGVQKSELVEKTADEYDCAYSAVIKAMEKK